MAGLSGGERARTMRPGRGNEMEFGLFTCGYQRTALAGAFADAKAFGYAYVELWGGRPHAYGPDLTAPGSLRLQEIRELQKRFAMPVLVFTPEHNAYPFNYMLGDRLQWADSLDYLKTCLHAASLLGAGAMLVSAGHGGNVPYEERYDRLVNSLSILAKAAGEEGVKLYLETLTSYESNICTTLPELCRVLKDVNDDRLYAICDVAAPFSAGEDPADYARMLGERLAHVHLVDNDGKSDIHLIPGEGVMPLGRIVSDLREAGYKGGATLELVTHYIDEPRAAAKRAIEAARELC